ncbi:hypothetical protein AKJ41_05885 [candidate division MSBL1 archaeon SCGC-AAA259O05]|uniref:Uncharacterized protein n=1 Tax=candidate division MSBL1 archaeon SCGC-AAA259O05 TaxID=1698271 RepID=A0A133UY99_9EURY|nr:hypothetical protein AKJ41_05885 [candidate division MSBL1 archaeon SCGC-AAA259O05]
MRANSENSKAREAFSLLSKKGTLPILNEVNSKLISKRDTPNKLGLTKRQYYPRLRELQNMNLIQKEGEGYVFTEKGERFYKSIKKMIFTCEIEKQCDSERTSILKSLPENENLKIITDYDKLAEQCGELFKEANSEIVIASRYLDYRVINSVLEMSENVDLRVITSRFEKFSSIQFLKSLTSYEKLKKFYKLAFENAKVISTLPYSFMVKDREWTLFEVINQIKPDSFFLAILVKNKNISNRFLKIFDNLFKMTEEDFVNEEFSAHFLEPDSTKDDSLSERLKKLMS